MNEKIENLGGDCDKRASPMQFPPIRVEYAVLKKIAQDEIPLSAPVRNCNTGFPKEKWRSP
jgi:hypothetical protein